MSDSLDVLGESLDAVGSLADLMWQVNQQRAVANQASRTATLEERVQRLEHQLDSAQRVLRELLSRLAKRFGDEPLRDAVAAFKVAAQAQGSGDARGEAAPERELPESPGERIKCLDCGHAMREDESKCPSCGWSYVGQGEAV
jgi:rubrerythrin